jgi:16S rRNA C967 or C1407 C5-methylase (RsmB/RsmF family)/NOL1/NOP2/fmu family ribosome biogenesis protein
VNLPPALLDSLAGVPGFERELFEQVHHTPEKVTSIRVNPAKPIHAGEHFNITARQIPYCENGYWLASRPSFTFDPLFHAGCYYVQEASSMFLEQALKQTTDVSQPLRVLDLCAAPGGKSTHLQSLISSDSLLVSNEVIRARANILKDNVIKWGATNVVVTNNDPADFKALTDYFDVIVVDAPCSGSGLFRREPEAINEWSPNNVALCSQRQQRILADVWPALKQGGILIYSTCSYSREEDEEIMNWLNTELQADSVALNIDGINGVIPTGDKQNNYGYRFWPYNIDGEGFFISCFRKATGGDTAIIRSRKKIDQPTRSENEFIREWTRTDAHQMVKHLNLVYAWPGEMVNELNWLLEQLHVLYAGTLIGELMRNKLVPAHALALSPLISTSVKKLPLMEADVIKFLQRKDIVVDGSFKGWHLITYNNFPLGWINALPNRVNNYYPKELRILKDI